MIDPMQLMVLKQILGQKERDGRGRRGKRTSRSGKKNIILGNSQGRMYNPLANVPLPATGGGPPVPRGPDVGHGPGATPPGNPMGALAAANMRNSVQGAAQMPQHMANLLNSQQGGYQQMMPKLQGKKGCNCKGGGPCKCKGQGVKHGGINPMEIMAMMHAMGGGVNLL